MSDPRELVDRLGLTPHPEGGYFRETYRSLREIPADALGGAFSGARPVSTGIYYMLVGEDVSVFHRIRSDEMWHHYAGSPVVIHAIGADGGYEATEVGSDLAAGQRPQAVVPAGVWFAAELADASGYALVGCTVAPGFDYADFELADRRELLRVCPDERDLILRLTRAAPG